jgi:hypothetical protein
MLRDVKIMGFEFGLQFLAPGRIDALTDDNRGQGPVDFDGLALGRYGGGEIFGHGAPLGKLTFLWFGRALKT